MGNYEIAVLVGWAIATWALCSVLFSDPAKFSNLGRSKWRWFLIELTACQGTSGLPCGRTADLLAGGQVMSVLAVS